MNYKLTIQPIPATRTSSSTLESRKSWAENHSRQVLLEYDGKTQVHFPVSIRATSFDEHGESSLYEEWKVTAKKKTR